MNLIEAMSKYSSGAINFAKNSDDETPIILAAKKNYY
jgi:hypothetical protein